MKKILLVILLVIFVSYVKCQSDFRFKSGYYKPSTGTYVQPHYKTESNSTNIDNFSTKGNMNPYTGEKGTRAKDYSIDAFDYGKGKSIETGPRGGQFYYNDKGTKTYVPKRW